MAETASPTDWSDEMREEHLRRTARGGWSRIRPQVTMMLLIGAIMEGAPLTREELGPFVATHDNPDGALTHSCWDTGDEFDEEEAAEAAEALPGQVTDATRYAAQYGLPPLETIDDVITLLVAAKVLHEIPDSTGRLRLHPTHPLPFPSDVLPLSDEEEQVQRELRMSLIYSDDSFEIIGMFEPEGRRLEEITTSLQRLARAIDGDPHDARQAVLLLLGEGDFTATEDVAAIPLHKVFRLRCDWQKFDQSRIALRGVNDDGQIAVTLPED
ncbi:DUF6042 family protein [Kitasatospora sp. MBT63]|uniref:DUF6042 family protein n=1 Tax=Kitasatospora sp. MBT63 TaxID=1444768 RepID=UPI00053B2262|nr:DUF6042 family protein [Kitasatospora sp. MBT63]